MARLNTATKDKPHIWRQHGFLYCGYLGCVCSMLVSGSDADLPELWKLWRLIRA